MAKVSLHLLVIHIWELSLSQNAKWNEHLENITKHLGILRKLKFSVSSTNNLLNDISFSLISFMYIRNMRGPNTDLWGTPAETGSKLDQEFLLITFCLLLNR
jgi:hypothetical protein